jgi:hypothetical protein
VYDTDRSKRDRPIRKTLWLTFLLLLFVPGFALLGAFAACDNGKRTPWPGIAAGAVVGLFFALVFGGAVPRKWADAIFGPSDDDRP